MGSNACKQYTSFSPTKSRSPLHLPENSGVLTTKTSPSALRTPSTTLKSSLMRLRTQQKKSSNSSFSVYKKVFR